MDSPKSQINRRRFLSAAIAAMSSLIGAIVGVPAVAYIIGPALKQQAEDWVQLGAINKVDLGSPTLFKTTVERQTGWISAQEEVAAYVLTENGQDFAAISNVCTHLACRVRWIEGEQQFFCPCHNGIFGKDGSVIGGPPPRPLDRFETKIENGVLFIRRS